MRTAIRFRGNEMSTPEQIRENILKFLWEADRPLSLKEVAGKIGLKNQAIFMHLFWLRKAGQVQVSERNIYSITGSGKEVLGFPRMDAELASKVLSKTPPEKAFYFYYAIDRPLEISSDNIADFGENLRTVEIGSLEFHMGRGDFELWIQFLGDAELAKKLSLIKEQKTTGETLRERLYHTVKDRCVELQQKASRD